MDKVPSGYPRIVRKYKQNSGKRNNAWKLTNEECYQLFQQNCFYCGAKPNTRINRGKQKGKTYYSCVYNGIDRINNKVGYVLYNVVTCCGTCNFMKGKLGLDVFIKQVRKIARRSRKWKIP